MPDPISTVLVAVFFVAGGVLCGVTVLAWWRIRSPAVNLFAIVAGVAAAGAFALSIGFAFESPTFVLASTIVLGLLFPIPWAVFTFGYTGRERLVSLRTVSVVATPAAVGIVATVVVFGSHTSSGVDLASAERASGLVAAAITFLNISQWFALLYAGGLMLVSSGMLLWTFHRYDHLDSTTGTTLGVFGTVPWLSILFGLQVQPISPLGQGSIVAVGILVGAGASVALVGPFPLFERVPAAANVGPKTIVEELSDLVVVTDGDGSVVEINQTARRTLDVTAASVLGADVEELLHTSVTDLQATDRIELESDDGRTLFEPAVSRLTDQHDHLLGYAVVLRDVTARTTRKQHLEVFNRVLRHNLRNDMTVVNGHAEMIASRAEDDAIVDSAESILQTGRELTSLAQTVRETEGTLNVDEPTDGETRLAPLVADVLAAATSDRDRPTCRSDVPDGVVVEARKRPLRLALSHLVENAIEHNDNESPTVRISAEYDRDETYPLRVSIADDGPGIPELELQTIEAGVETPLQHSTGIGLWIVRWVVTVLGGKLEFSERPSRGTIVSIHLPAAHETRPAAESLPAESGDA